jgi:lariat debranching enzyme
VMWYTNPQTEAFCDLIGVENVINPVPKEATP